MNIGLIGVPGSGKSKLARRIKLRNETDTWIVDDYVGRVEERYDLACGAYGSYLADLAVAVERTGQERVANPDHDGHRVTCGTLLDTVVYRAFHTATEGGQWAWAVANIIMPVFSLMAQSMDYDALYLLRAPEGARDYHLEIDATYGDAIGAFKLNIPEVIELPDDSTARLDKVMEIFAPCPECGEGLYESKSPGGTETWTCGHTLGK